MRQGESETCLSHKLDYTPLPHGCHHATGLWAYFTLGASFLKVRVRAARPSWSGTRVPGFSGDPVRAGVLVRYSARADAGWERVAS